MNIRHTRSKLFWRKRIGPTTMLLCLIAFTLSLPRYAVAMSLGTTVLYILMRVARCGPNIVRALQGVSCPQVLKAPPIPQLILFIVVMMCLLPFSTNVAVSFRYFLHVSACLTVFLLLVGLRELAPHRRRTRFVVHACLLGATVDAAYGIYQAHVTGHLYINGLQQEHLHSVYGSILVTAILAAMALLLAARCPLRRAAYFGVVCLCGIALALSQARGPWVALALSCPVVVYLSRQRLARNRKRAIYSLGAAAALALILTPLYVGHALTIIDPKWEPNSERVLIWKSTLHMIEDHPLVGVGAGMFSTVYNARYISPASVEGFHPHAHNSYLMILSEDGILGFAAFLYLLWGIAIFLQAALRENPTSPYIIGTIGVFCSLIINSFVDHFLFSGYMRSEWILWLLLGLVYYDRLTPRQLKLPNPSVSAREYTLA